GGAQAPYAFPGLLLGETREAESQAAGRIRPRYEGARRGHPDTQPESACLDAIQGLQIAKAQPESQAAVRNIEVGQRGEQLRQGDSERLATLRVHLGHLADVAPDFPRVDELRGGILRQSVA